MSGQPLDLFAEIRAVSAEALRLAREGGSVEERAAYDARKARVMAVLEEHLDSSDLLDQKVEQSTRAIAPVVGVSDRQVRYDREAIEQGGSTSTLNTETGEVSDDYPATSTGAHCQDWPLCGHDDDEHVAIARTIERTKSVLRARGALD